MPHGREKSLRVESLLHSSSYLYSYQIILKPTSCPMPFWTIYVCYLCKSYPYYKFALSLSLPLSSVLSQNKSLVYNARAMFFVIVVFSCYWIQTYCFQRGWGGCLIPSTSHRRPNVSNKNKQLANNVNKIQRQVTDVISVSYLYLRQRVVAVSWTDGWKILKKKKYIYNICIAEAIINSKAQKVRKTNYSEELKWNLEQNVLNERFEI